MNKKIEIMILTIMCFVLTIAIMIQINTVKNNGTTIGLSQTESNLKTQVLRMKEKYENQYQELEKAEKELERVRQVATNNNTELLQIQDKIKKYNLIIGNTDIKGTGVTVTLKDGETAINSSLDTDNLIIHAENVLAVVNELKNAGAEAIAINGQRMVNTTAIPCDGNVIVVNGSKVSTPIVITAIGYPELLTTLNRPGGTLERFTSLGKNVEMKKYTSVKIPKYAGVMTFKYAKTIN